MITINAPTGEQFRKLVEYVNELVRDHNALEQRVVALEKQPAEHGDDLQPEVPLETES